MKRKLIQNLLKNDHSADLRERIAEVIPSTASEAASTARQVLADAIEVSQKHRLMDPVEFYGSVCSSTTWGLAVYLQGTSSAGISPAKLAGAQVVLNEALTSKAGRKKTSGLSRQQQLAVAQSNRRDKVKEEGRKRINVWITPEAAAYLEAIKLNQACKSQAEALERVLAAAMKGELLPQAD
jgi:hypothetical protein